MAASVSLSPKRISNSLWRAVLPTAAVSAPTRTEVRDVTPGDIEVPSGTRLEVIAELAGQPPEAVTLLYTTADRRFVEEPVVMRDTDEGRHRYRCILSGENGRGLLQATEYQIVAGDAQTSTFRISVVQPPSAKVTAVRYDYPEYMELEGKTDPTGHIDAWEGTAVTLTAKANMPLTSATLQFADDAEATNKAEEIPLQIIDGTTLRGEWRLKLRSDGTYPHHYRIQCKNERGDTDPEPTLYNVTIRPDEPPEVTLLDPAGDIERPANAIVPLLFHARDPDFKLNYVTLRAEQDEAPIADEVIFEGSQQEFGGTYDFRLERLRLKSGDVVTFWIEARDNKQPIGNRKNTPQINIRIVEPVTDEEVQQQLEADKQRQQESLEPAGDQDPPPDDSQPEADQPDTEPAEADESGEEGGTEEGSQQAPGETDQTGEQEGSESSEEQGAQPGTEGEQGGESKQPKLDPDNPDDTGEVLEKIYKRMQQEQQQDGEQQGGNPQDGEQQDGKQPRDSSPGESDNQQKSDQSEGSDGTQEKPPREQGDRESSAGENASDPQGGQQSTDDAPSPEQPGQSSKPGGKQPGEESGEQQGSPQDGKSDPSQRKESPATEGQPPGEQGQGNAEQGEPTGEQPDGTEQRGTDKSAEGPQEGARKQDAGEGQQPPQDGDASGDPSSGKPDAANSKPGEDNSQTDPASDQGMPAQESDPNSKPQQKQSDVDRPDSSRPPDADSGDPQSGETPPKGTGRPQGAPSEETPPPADSAIKPDQPPEGGGAPGESSPSPAQGEGDSPMPGEQRDGDASKASDPQQNDGAGEQQSGESGGESSEQSGKPSGGQPSDPTGEQTGEGQPGSSQPGQQEGGEGENSSSQSESGQGQQPGGSQSKQGAPTMGGDAQGEKSAKAGQGEGGASEAAGSDAANLEYAKEAADLVLKRLQGELERGEVDQDLLDELGWTEDEVRKFTNRLKDRLDAPAGDTPESVARRRQFEETLKTLDLKSSYGPRQGSGVRSTRSDSIGPRRSPVPAEYRDDYNAFTRSRAKRGRNTSKP